MAAAERTRSEREPGARIFLCTVVLFGFFGPSLFFFTPKVNNNVSLVSRAAKDKIIYSYVFGSGPLSLVDGAAVLSPIYREDNLCTHPIL